MKEINYKSYPYNYLIIIQSTFEKIRSQVKLNSNKVRITKDYDFCIVIEDLDYNSKFKYTINTPVQKDNRFFLK